MANLFLVDSYIDAGKGESGEINISLDSNATYYSRKYTTLHYTSSDKSKVAVMFLMNESKWTYNSSNGSWSYQYGWGLSYRKDLTTASLSDTIYINGNWYSIDHFIPYDAHEVTSERTVKWLYITEGEKIQAGNGGTRVSPEVAVKTRAISFSGNSTTLQTVNVYVPKMTWIYPKNIFTVKLDPKDCKLSSTNDIKVIYGKQFYLPSISKSPTTSTFTRKIKYIDTLDPAGNYELTSTDGKTLTSYDDFYYKRESDGVKLYSTDAQTWYRDDTLSAKYSTAVTETTLETKVGTLPTQPVVNGYINKGWYTTPQWDQGERITSTTEIYKDSQFYSGRDGKVYTISFKLNPSGASFEGSDPGTMQKKFGTDAIAPTSIPTRFGYEFVGWHPDKNVNWFNSAYSPLDKDVIRTKPDWWNQDIIRPGQKLTAENFDKKYSITGSNVILYSIWRPINHYILAKYYTWVGDEQNFTLREFKVRYTIENTVVDVQSPATYNQPSMTGNWVFYGWKQPENMAEFNDTHGIYRNINLISGVQLPWSYASKFDGDWIEGTITNTIYGFWTITGKYFCVDQNDWKKITCIYVKDSDGRWIPMNGTSSDSTSFSVNINGTWKKEVYL